MDAKDVAKHNTVESCWVILYGHVYDVTEFLPSHPGGSKIILQLAGQDATEEYDPVHPPGTLERNLNPEAKLGEIDATTLPKPDQPPPETSSEPPALDTLLNLNDVEDVASKRISRKAWAYYYSAADDLISKNLNSEIYRSIF
ncbi:MAG: hypothetical protein M1837_004603 [Sclerophora amabilis]|nr:MAG: hypothetical protein M1837_004603 [Sclerophora amabilis]